MAKFKKGDKVTDGNAVYEITDVDDGVYKWRPIGGKGDKSYSEGGEIEWAERKMRLANAACNAKDGFGAEIKVGDRAKFITGTWRGLEGTVTKIEGNKATVKTDEQGEVVEDLKLIRAYNSRAVCSTNSVVQNAIKARRARNAVSPDAVKRQVLAALSEAKQAIAKARQATGAWEIDEAQGLAYDIDDLAKECENLIQAAKGY